MTNGNWPFFDQLNCNADSLSQEDHNDQNKDDWVRENRDENQDHNHDDQDSQLGTSLRLNVSRLIGPIGQYGHHKKNTGEDVNHHHCHRQVGGETVMSNMNTVYYSA